MSETLSSGLRHRLLPEEGDEGTAQPVDPYGGRVYLARRKKKDSILIRILEGSLLVATVFAGLYVYFYFDNVHFHITHAYAHLGYSTAQHQVGQRYLNGVGVEKHPDKAMEWFKKASDQGHPHATYNLAIGHLKGYKTGLQKGDAHHLIKKAASKGVYEAKQTINDICAHGGCN